MDSNFAPIPTYPHAGKRGNGKGFDQMENVHSPTLTIIVGLIPSFFLIVI